ncbi:MAG: GH32 C-terminal domain-containing protein [Solobacterium sp.]|nr:GH32 C-terminal domain-containing protein [Solobacterium sp.]
MHFSAETKTITVDRTGMNKRFNTNVFEVLDMPLEKELRSMRIFIDRSSIEIFVNDGEAVFSSHVYPEDNEHFYTKTDNAALAIWSLTPSVTDDFVM